MKNNTTPPQADTPTEKRPYWFRLYLRNLEFEKIAASQSTPLQDTKNNSFSNLKNLPNLLNLLE